MACINLKFIIFIVQLLKYFRGYAFIVNVVPVVLQVDYFIQSMLIWSFKMYFWTQRLKDWVK